MSTILLIVRGHEYTMQDGSGRRRRRTHTAAFKAEAVAACRKPRASIAAAAMERSIKVEAERTESMTVPPKLLSAPEESFVALPIPPTAVGATPIRVEVRRGTLTVSVQWPRSAMHECAAWLREVLK